MAKVSFGERYRTDNRFKQAVEDLKNEAIFRALGLVPEMINEAWDGNTLNIVTILEKSGKVKLAVATQEKSRAEVQLTKLSEFLREFFPDEVSADGGGPVDDAVRILGVLVPEGVEDDEDEDKE